MKDTLDELRSARHRLAELLWTRSELQITQASVRSRVKVRRADAPRHGRRDQVAGECSEEIQLLRELHDDLQKLNAQIDDLRDWIDQRSGRNRFTPAPPD